jgi:hypothetical protein
MAAKLPNTRIPHTAIRQFVTRLSFYVFGACVRSGMKEVRQSLLIGVCLSSLSTAQTHPPLLDPQYFALAAEHEQAERENGERSRAQFSERQLHERMNRVVEAWKGLVEEYNAKRAFNIRKARDLSKAFWDLEHADCWPKTERK